MDLGCARSLMVNASVTDTDASEDCCRLRLPHIQAYDFFRSTASLPTNENLTDADASEERTDFLRLPPELRIQVYDTFFADLTHRGIHAPWKDIINLTSILCTSHQLYAEAGEVFLRYHKSIAEYAVTVERMR